MVMLDVFRNDAFSVVSLTEGIDKIPFAPSRIGAMNLFNTQAVPTTTVAIEERHGKLSLIPTRARNTMPTSDTAAKRKVRSFQVPHIPKNDTVMADDVQNVRSFGSENNLESVSEMVAQKLGNLRADHEVTWEFHRLGAVKGIVLDANGTDEIYNWFTEFVITPLTQSFSLAATDPYQTGASAIKRSISDSLGGTAYTGIHAFCGAAFWDQMVQHTEVKNAYDRWREGEFLRSDHVYEQFTYAGITWEEYRGAIGGTDFVNTDKAHFFPVGVRGLFTRFNGPGTFIEAANTLGRPIYVKQKVNDWETGVDIHTQSNPLFVCTRPKVLIEGTRTA